MTRRAVLLAVCGDGGVDPRRIAEAALTQGCTVVFALADSPYAHELAPAMAALGAVVEAEDLGGLRRYQPGGIITFSESELARTAELAAELGLPYLDAAGVRAVTDKDVQREALRAAGIPLATVPAPITRHAPELSPGALSTVRPQPDRLTVDCVADGERAVPVFVTGALIDAGSGNARGGYGPPSRSQASEIEQAAALAVRATDALGIGRGITSVEIARVDGAFQVVEVNGRLGAYTDALALVSAVCDPVALAVGAALDRRVPPQDLLGGHVTAFQLVVPAPAPGSDDLAAIMAAPGVARVQIGDDAQAGAGVQHRPGSALISGRVGPNEQLAEALAGMSTPGTARLPARNTVAPRTAAERELAGLFAQALHHDSFGVDENLLDLGISSLTAVRTAERIRIATGADISVADVFAFPSVAALARLVSVGTGPRLPRLVPRPLPAPLPLSSAQARLWFLHKLDGPNDTYNVPLVWQVSGEVDITALDAALTDVLGRHESLRTVFGAVEGVPFQRIVDPADLASCLTVLDVPETELAAAVNDACRFCFDLAVDLPVRSWLLRTGESATFVLLVHHIAVDGESLRPLLGDLGEAYAARRAGTRPGWPELNVQYADYSVWQRALLGEGPASLHPLLRADLDYWTTELADASPALVPTDHPRPPDEADHPSALASFEIGADVHLGLLKIARACRTTLFVTLHAAVALLLRERGAGPDIHIGVPIAGRDAEELDDLVGMFVNTVILRADVSGEPTFRQLVTQLAHRDVEALAHGRIPFEHVLGLLNHRRAGGPDAGFQVMLGLEHPAPTRLTLAGAECVALPTETEMAKCDLDITFTAPAPPVTRSRAGLSGVIQYDLAVFDPATVDALAARLVHLLGECVAGPDDPRPAPQPAEYDGRIVEALVELFAAALERPEAEIGLDDDFFDLGGDRLRAVRLVNRVRVAMDVDFEITDLERMPSVAALATWLNCVE